MNQKPYQHFIITRFNLRKKEWNTTRDKTQVLTDEWMDNRLVLFEKYCYSSVKNQTNSNFIWLVFFDRQTPEKYRKIITRLENSFVQFRAFYIDGMTAYLTEIKQEIKKELNKELKSPYLITSRLDNDDSLHQDYVAEIQKQFSQQKFMAIDIVDGFTLQVEPLVKLGKRSHVHNPFISLIENSDHFETVWSRERHGEWAKVKNLKPIRNKRLWMSIIHAENKANDFLGYGDVDWHETEKFNIDAELLDQLKNKNIPVSQWRGESLKHQIKTQWKVGFKLLKRRLKI